MNNKEEIRHAIEKEIYERSYYEFFKEAVKIIEPATKWKMSFHHKYLCDLLEEQIDRIGQGIKKDKDYVVNIPPRTTKSLIFSVCLNAWAWTKYPHLKFMTISYGENLAIKLSYQTKLIITSDWYKKYWNNTFSLSKDDNQKGSYSNDKGGIRQSFGMTGGITGSGADVIIVDDPNKPNEISSGILEKIKNVYKDTIYNRINDPEIGVRMLIQQRTHEKDLSGYLLSSYEDEIEHICLPMELSDNIKPHYLSEFYVNDLLHEDRFSKQIISKYKRILGTRGYSGQYKQKPSDEESAIIKKQWFKIIKYDKEIHDKLTWHLFLDSAYTEDKKNDPSGIILCAKYQNCLIIKKAWKFYLSFPDLVKKLKELYVKYCTNKSKIYVEPKASGISIIQQIKRDTKINVIKIKPPKDSKEVRLNAVSPIVESERIYLIDDNWNEDFIEEVVKFPVAEHDEYPDLLVYSIENIINKQTEFNYAFS